MRKYYLFIFTLLFLNIGAANAQYTDLLNFDKTNGEYPQSNWYSGGSLILSGNVLYGLASQGGVNDYGLIFSINPDGSGYKDMFDFDGSNGSYPLGSLTLYGSLLYGMTNEGGAYGYGCIFTINVNGVGYSDIYDFDGTYGGGGNSLTRCGSVFYGMTSQILSSSASIGCCIFSINFDGSGYKVVNSLGDSNIMGGGALVLSGGMLYGITQSFFTNGYIFSIDTDGTGFRILNDTISSMGSSLILSGNKLYGTTGLNVFSIDTDGNGLKYIYDNLDQGGYSSLVLSGSTLYGTSRFGGGWGNIYSLDTNGSGYMDLYDFIPGKNPLEPGSLIISGNVLYGMTMYGGTDTVGTVFSYKDTITGISNLTTTTGAIKLFPNPNNGVFQIQAYSYQPTANGQIEVYNMLGEKVCTQWTIDNGQWTFNLSSEPSGIYLYRVINETRELIGEGKFIIQK
ncbi:MAG: choice-of-anchor tandem repeat GloVer-containing protein [Bacteroidia bacterium]